MRSRTQPSHRDGFTLIELLVVVSILALLVGLTMAGISRVKTGQLATTTETVVKKLQVGLNQQLTAEMDEATKKGNPFIESLKQTIQDNDDDRARSLLCYAYSKRTFPMNFQEAKLPFIGAIPPHSAFGSTVLPTGLSSDQQAAVLLYIVVHDMAARGTTVDAEGALAGAEMVLVDPTSGKSYKAYKDAYGTHIAFLRWYGSNLADPRCQDLQNPPYISLNDKANGQSLDPFDRWGKLRMAWPAPNLRAGVLTALNNKATITLPNFDGLNKTITVVSAGPDRTFGTPDDVFGYPLARFGARGD